MMDLEYSDPEQTVRCLSLCAAVLQQTIQEIRGQATTNESGKIGEEFKKRRMFASIRYVRANDTHYFSYLWVCDWLNVDPDFIREAIKDGSILRWQPNSIGVFYLRPI